MRVVGRHSCVQVLIVVCQCWFSVLFVCHCHSPFVTVCCLSVIAGCLLSSVVSCCDMAADMVAGLPIRGGVMWWVLDIVLVGWVMIEVRSRGLL